MLGVGASVLISVDVRHASPPLRLAPPPSQALSAPCLPRVSDTCRMPRAPSVLLPRQELAARASKYILVGARRQTPPPRPARAPPVCCCSGAALLGRCAQARVCALACAARLAARRGARATPWATCCYHTVSTRRAYPTVSTRAPWARVCALSCAARLAARRGARRSIRLRFNVALRSLREGGVCVRGFASA